MPPLSTRAGLLIAALVVAPSLLVACSAADDMSAGTTETSTDVPTATAAAAAEGSTSSSSTQGRAPVVITSADIPAPEPAAAPDSPDGPSRIVSLATGVGETLAALGVGDRVVGRDETSSAPTIDDAPVMTRAHAVSAEAVLASDPDVVLVDASTSPPEAIEQIRAAGISVVEVPEAWTLADVAARTRAVADAVGVAPSTASRVASAATTTSWDGPTGSSPRVAFLYLRGPSAVYLLGGDGSGADDLIEAAGGVDVGAALSADPFIPLTAEALAAADPQVLLVMTEGLESVGGIDGLVALPGVAQTTAGRDRRVIAVEDTLLLSFGPRTGALVEALASALADVRP